MRSGTVVLVHCTLVSGPDWRPRRVHIVARPGHAPAIVDGSEPPPPGERVDASTWWASPPWVDLWAHVREPGYEWMETIETASRAGAAGGWGTVCALPETRPPVDHGEVAAWVAERGRRAPGARVVPLGAATRGLQGESLADIGEMKAAGCVAITQGTVPLASARMVRRVFEYARTFDLPVLSAPLDAHLSVGVAHEGPVAARLGLEPIPTEAETVALARDLELARRTGVRLVVGPLSTARGVAMVRRAKEDGLAVRAFAALPNLVWTDALLATWDPSAHTVPPLRDENDRQALVEGVADGTIDAIASGHAPASPIEKEREFERTLPGMSALELAPAALAALVGRGELDVGPAVRALAGGPRSCLGWPAPSARAASETGLVVVDPGRTWTVDRSTLHSRGHNTPWFGQRVAGRAVALWQGARLVHWEVSAQPPTFDSPGNVESL